MAFEKLNFEDLQKEERTSRKTGSSFTPINFDEFIKVSAIEKTVEPVKPVEPEKSWFTRPGLPVTGAAPMGIAGVPGAPAGFAAMPIFGTERKGWKLTDAGWISDEPEPITEAKSSVMPGVTDEEARGRSRVPELRTDYGLGVEPPRKQGILDKLAEPFRWAMTETEPAAPTLLESVQTADYWTRVLPTSVSKAAGGILRFFFYDLPKPFTDAVVNYAYEAWKQRASSVGVAEASAQFIKDLGRGVYGHVKGLMEFIGIPFGVYFASGKILEAFGVKEIPEEMTAEMWEYAWNTDPVGSLLAVTSLIKGAYSETGGSLIERYKKMKAEAAILKEKAAKTQNAEMNRRAEIKLEKARKARQEVIDELSPEVQAARQEFLQVVKNLELEKKAPAIVADTQSRQMFAEAVKKFELLKEPPVAESVAPAGEVPASAATTIPKTPKKKTSTVKKAQLSEPAAEVSKPQETPAQKAPVESLITDPEAQLRIYESLDAPGKKKLLRRWGYKTETELRAAAAGEPLVKAEASSKVETSPKIEVTSKTEATPTTAPELPDFKTWLRKEHGIKAPKFIDEGDLRIQYPELAEIYGAKKGPGKELPGEGIPDVELISVFDVTPEVARARGKNYEAKAHHVAKDIELSTMKLVNDVNLWKAGEEVNIAQVREHLTTLATRADEFFGLFDGQRSFEHWKDMVQRAAEWARRSERSVGKGGVKLSSGIDPLEAIHQVKALLDSGVTGVTHAARRLVAEGKWTDPKALMAAYEANGKRLAELLAAKKYDEAGKWAAWNQALREGAELITQTGSMKGVKLSSGADVVEGIAKMYENLRKLKHKSISQYLHEKSNQAIRMFLDVSGNIKARLYAEDGQNVVELMVLRKGAGAKASAILDQARREVYGGLNRTMRDILDEVIFSRRTVIIDSVPRKRAVKHPGGFGGKEHLEYLKALGKKRGLSPKQIADLHKRADIYFDVAKDQLRQLREEGLITAEQYENLKHLDYSRRQLIHEIDPMKKRSNKNGLINVRESGVSDLAIGKPTDVLETDSQLLMAELVVRTQNRIASNRLNRGMADFIRENPKNSIGRLPKKDGGTGRRPGDLTVHYYVDGKKKSLYLDKAVGNEWLTYNHAIEFETSNFLRIMSGSPILRPMATGINPAFALRNLPRDLQHIWTTANYLQDGKWKSVYSPHLPIAMGQMAVDIAMVWKDAFTRKGRWQDYINEGGGMEFLVHQGRPVMRTRLGLRTHGQRLYDVLGYLNETSEILGRLALRERALKRGLSNQSATFVARDYLDFSQAGTTARAIDTVVPYFNARIQATRGVWRSLRRNPQEGAIKIGWIMATAVGLYLLQRSSNKEAFDEISPSDRANYWIIMPSGMSYKDEHGQKRYPYFRIPKDNGQKFFAYLAEALMAKHMGDQIDVDQLVNTLGELSPIASPLRSLPPLAQAFGGYAMNKDFWTNEDIWKGPKVPAEEEFDAQTPEGFKLFGKIGLSPKRMQYFASRFITSSSVYSDLTLTGLDKMLSEVPESQREMFWAEALKKGGLKGGFGILDSFIGITHPLNKSGAKIDEIQEQDNLRRWVNTRTVDGMIERWLVDKTAEKKDVLRAVRDVKDVNEQKRLLERVMFAWKTRELTQYSFWMRLQELTPEARAAAYHDYWQRASEEERAQIRRERKKVSSLFSDRFFKELKRLRREAP